MPPIRKRLLKIELVSFPDVRLESNYISLQ